MLRWRCIRIWLMVTWSVYTNDACSAPWRINFQHSIGSVISNSSLPSGGYHGYILYNIQLISPSTISEYFVAAVSATPIASLLAWTCRKYLASGSGQGRSGGLLSLMLRLSKVCLHSMFLANGVRLNILGWHRRCLTSHWLLGFVPFGYDSIAMSV
jgi:hypothetical protein